MLVFQANDARQVGPVRSSRLYFVSWAAEWRAVYAHVGGSPNSLRTLRSIDRKLVWNIDEYTWTNYFWRVRSRPRPHNTYATTTRLRSLGRRLGGTATMPNSPWTFVEETSRGSRPRSGRLVVPYTYNQVSYRYDRATNRYNRSVSGASPQRDLLTGRVVAPANVIVVFARASRAANRPGESTNQQAGRIDLETVGNGRALVLRNGEVVQARWSKSSFSAPMRLTYASGCNAGKRVPLVAGQIFIQVVPVGTRVTASGREPSC
jgi:hypothetical protein